jgi:hypothetical protein
MKDRFDTSTLFLDGTLKRKEESPLLRILNQMGGAIFNLHEGFVENKKHLITLT